MDVNLAVNLGFSSTPSAFINMPGADSLPYKPPHDSVIAHSHRHDAHDDRHDHFYYTPDSSLKYPHKQLHKREQSIASSSSSDYSSTSDAAHPASEPSSGLTRRSTLPSHGGADRRRVAIVQMDSLSEASPHEHDRSNSTLRSRRGIKTNLDGLALVAPPDAAPKTYSQLTPPTTAPIAGHLKSQLRPADPPSSREEKGHSRFASELAPSKHTPPRDVAIVGSNFTRDKLVADTELPASANGLRPPVFQRPAKSRSPSPALSAASDLSGKSHHSRSPQTTTSTPVTDHRSPIITPEIGQSKEIHVPVAAPVVVSLSNDPIPSGANTPRSHATEQTSSPLSSNERTLYLNYQPGVDATAGPLPPPPRATFNIDINTPPPPRPPRVNSPLLRQRGDLEAVKQALQLPPSVSAVLAGKSLEGNEDNSSASAFEISSGPEFTHRREGASATAESENLEKSLAPDAVDERKEHTAREDIEGPAIVVIEPLMRMHNMPLASVPEQEKSDDVENSHEMSPSPDDRRAFSLDRSARSISPTLSRSPSSGDAPSPPPKSLRNSIGANLKRFSSLPRTPSLSSRSARRSSGGTRCSSRTPSPSFLPPIYVAPHRRIVSKSPPAMFCHEVFSCRSTAERCVIYADKINELYLYDSGLSDWLMEAKYKEPTAHRGPRSAPFNPQPRQTSRSSMISEATFPRRPDATTATDLSFRSHLDDVPTSAPPQLPYPSLATAQRANPPRSASISSGGTPTSSLRSLTPSNPSSKATGFFASLGRKASISSGRREKPGLNPSLSSGSSSSGKLLTKPPPFHNNISRPINIPANPSVPGGPRALPSRVMRSQTLMATTNSFSSTSFSDRKDTIGRRPSMFSVIDITPDPEFSRQVDKLVDLLPHADRVILAGYLRRSGQDVLAIGQYLEDEKNGTIRYAD